MMKTQSHTYFDSEVKGLISSRMTGYGMKFQLYKKYPIITKNLDLPTYDHFIFVDFF